MIHEKSNDTKIIEAVLREAKVGDLITYAKLTEAIGRDVRTFAQPSLRSARHSLLRQGVVFGVEVNEGLRRLNDEEIVDSTESDRRRMKRAATRSLKKLSVVNFDALPEDKKRQHVVSSAQMGAIEMFSTKTTTKRIEAKVDDGKKTLAIGETLKMFS